MAKNKKIPRTPEAQRVITARNYAAQAERDLLNFAKNTSIDNQVLSGLSELIRRSVHFVVPDNGKIFDASFKGLDGLICRLPYECVTVEYFDSRGHKFIIAAFQTDTDIVFTSFNYDSHYRAFIPYCPYWVEIDTRSPMQICSAGYTIHKNRILSNFSDDSETYETICDMVKYTGRVILELVEALSCRNVTTANHQEAYRNNIRRIKDGKLPIYETKMLVIDTKTTPGEYHGSGGSHASPRQHLRRGHIRRHPTAGNLWINSCVVGDPSKGVINKSYAVK